jgi:hypothetical protein
LSQVKVESQSRPKYERLGAVSFFLSGAFFGAEAKLIAAQKCVAHELSVSLSSTERMTTTTTMTRASQFLILLAQRIVANELAQ